MPSSLLSVLFSSEGWLSFSFVSDVLSSVPLIPFSFSVFASEFSAASSLDESSLEESAPSSFSGFSSGLLTWSSFGFSGFLSPSSSLDVSEPVSSLSLSLFTLLSFSSLLFSSLSLLCSLLSSGSCGMVFHLFPVQSLLFFLFPDL